MLFFPGDLSNYTFHFMEPHPKDILDDRLRIIKVDPLSEEQKVEIINKFMSRWLENVGLNPGDITISDNKIRLLIKTYPTPGIRILQNKLTSIFRKVNEKRLTEPALCSLPYKIKTKDIA